MRRARWIAGVTLAAAVAAGALALGPLARLAAGPQPRPTPVATRPPHPVALGAFLGSDAAGVAAVSEFQRWLGAATEVTVGRTYLPGDNWSDVEGDARIIKPWAAWHAAKPGRNLVLNVPMLAPNEADLSDSQVAGMLRQGANGAFDAHFRTLAQRLVAAGAGDTEIVLGWEMNGVTYSGRCRPDPAAWQAYWRRIVAVMRAVPGGRFPFDFAPTRGADAIPWTQCYPGDDVVDVVGMDSYDQQPGQDFGAYVSQPYGLDQQVTFAAAHGKPVAYPEWGLFRHGDDPDFIRAMHDWFRDHNTLYQTITDYCPHGVWGCSANPRSSAAYRSLFGGSRG